MLRFSEKVEELIREEESKKEQENNEGEDLSEGQTKESKDRVRGVR